MFVTAYKSVSCTGRMKKINVMFENTKYTHCTVKFKCWQIYNSIKNYHLASLAIHFIIIERGTGGGPHGCRANDTHVLILSASSQ